VNVSCGQCGTLFRVDPDKVPVAGVRARCSVCAGVFWVRREAAPAPAAPEPRREAALQPVAAPAPPPVSPAPLPPPPQAAPIPMPLPQAEPLPVQPPFRMPAPAVARPAVAPAPPLAAPGGPRPGPAVSPSPRPAMPPAAAAPLTPPAPRAPLTPRAAAPAAPARPTNPFLSQDPRARARRLARALVSDIVVYHPAKRRDGLRDGSLKLLFEEEIRKSWEEYLEQVGRELAESTSFFTDALNEILADGQPVFP